MTGLSDHDDRNAQLRQMTYRGEALTAPGKKGQVFLVGSLKAHNLTALAMQAGVPLDAPENALLDRLTTIVTWAGRYPVSIGEEGLIPGAGQYGPADGKAVAALAARLFTVADETPQLIGTGAGGQRVEMVKPAPGQWRIQLISGGAVQREAFAERSPDTYAIALDWTREINPPPKTP